MVNKRKKITEEDVKDIINTPKVKKNVIDMDVLLSTGSTLLDLAISGGRSKYGGVPLGIMVEIFGPSGAGKTGVLAELCASAQSMKGQVKFLDPEGRLDKEYSRIYGMNLSQEDYDMPDTVTDVFDCIKKWQPESDINVMGVDSLAALSTIMEMEGEDKRGQKRAKEFSEGLRKICRQIKRKKWLIACTNQVRQGDYGEITPGGKAIEFYSSLRMRVFPETKGYKIEKAVKFKEKPIKKIIGIKSRVFIRKSTIDDPFRDATISIIFGYGVDDIRENLQYIKDITGNTKYDAFEKEYQSIDRAIKCIEENGNEKKLKDLVVEIWHESEESFNVNRKTKMR